MAKETSRQPAFLTTEEANARHMMLAQAESMTRQDMFRLGILKPEQMSDEEIARGQASDFDGKFRKLSVQDRQLPKTVMEALLQEHSKRNNERLRQLSDRALDTMVGVMDDETAEPSDRFKAAQYIYERTNGKTPDKVAVTVTKEPWEEVFDGIAGTTQKQHKAISADPSNTIDAEVIDTTVEARPYGYIQVPGQEPPHVRSHVQQPRQPTMDSSVGQPGASPGGDSAPANPTTPPVEQPAEAKPYDPFDPNNVGGRPTTKDDLERQTLPRPQPERPFVWAAPDFRNPVNTMSTAPPHGMTGEPIQELPDPPQPLSEVVREGLESAAELAEKRKAAKGARDEAKKGRRQARPERDKAKGSRIAKRTLGLDALHKVDIKASISSAPNQDDPDAGVLRFNL